MNVLTGVANTPIGVGFTMIRKVRANPVQVTPPIVFCGVMVMLAMTGAAVGLVATKDGMLPVPVAARPMDGLLLVQLKTVPTTNPLKLMGDEGDPLQTV